MHVIVLAWDVERPDRLDPGVLGLARALTDRGVTCEVIGLASGAAQTRTVDGVEVTWASEAPPVLPDTAAYDLARVLAAATRVSAVAEQRCQHHVPDAVLAVGWQTVWTASTLRASRSLPLVALLDSTAPGRASGDLDDAGRLEAQVEWWLTYEARRVVASSQRVARDLRQSYRLPDDKVAVLPFGAMGTSSRGRGGRRREGLDPVARLVAVVEEAVDEEPAASAARPRPLRPMLRRSPLGLVRDQQ